MDDAQHASLKKFTNHVINDETEEAKAEFNSYVTSKAGEIVAAMSDTQRAARSTEQ